MFLIVYCDKNNKTNDCICAYVVGILMAICMPTTVMANSKTVEICLFVQIFTSFFYMVLSFDKCLI